jgi:hypothetical protein
VVRTDYYNNSVLYTHTEFHFCNDDTLIRNSAHPIKPSTFCNFTLIGPVLTVSAPTPDGQVSSHQAPSTLEEIQKMILPPPTKSVEAVVLNASTTF